jgi:hypothetical protein
MEISIRLPGAALRFDHGKCRLADCGQAFRDRRRVRRDRGHTGGALGGGGGYSRAEQQRCTNGARWNDHGNYVEVFLPKPHRNASSSMVSDALAKNRRTGGNYSIDLAKLANSLGAIRPAAASRRLMFQCYEEHK